MLTPQYEALRKRLSSMNVYITYVFRSDITKQKLNDVKGVMLSLLAFMENDDLKGAQMEYYDHRMVYRMPIGFIVVLSVCAWHLLWTILGVLFSWGICLGSC